MHLKMSHRSFSAVEQLPTGREGEKDEGSGERTRPNETSPKEIKFSSRTFFPPSAVSQNLVIYQDPPNLVQISLRKENKRASAAAESKVNSRSPTPANPSTVTLSLFASGNPLSSPGLSLLPEELRYVRVLLGA